MIHTIFCPRCGCCSVETQPNGAMTCYGLCDLNGVHAPETVEDFRIVLAEKDAEIERLRAENHRLETRR